MDIVTCPGIEPQLEHERLVSDGQDVRQRRGLAARLRARGLRTAFGFRT